MAGNPFDLRNGYPTGCLAGLLLLLLVLLAPSGEAFGLEIYSLVDKDCRSATGLIVNVDRGSIYLLTVEGLFAEFPRAEIKNILVYNTLDNPISQLELSGGLGERVREVSLTDKEKSKFIGWPIRFFENYIVFYDVEGKTHIQDTDKIMMIASPERLPERMTISENKKLQLGPGSFLPECPWSIEESAKETPPTRMIGDQIRIRKFLRVFQKGFEDLERFETRTVFYARNFMYEKPTKLGFTLSEEFYLGRKELPNFFPFSFQWSSGRSFGPQAFFALGSRPVELLPNVEPIFSVRTDAKAHLFTASFVGNPQAFSQGANFMVQNRFSTAEYFQRLGSGDLLVVPHFNNLALTGIERMAHSFSGGYYLPIFGIYGNGVFREVLATKPSPLARYMYTTQDLQFRVLYGITSIESAAPTTDDIILLPQDQMKQPALLGASAMLLQQNLEYFSLDAQFIRLGLDLESTKEVQVGLDEVFLFGVYEESNAGDYFRVAFDQYITSLHVVQRFGQRVILKAYVNYFERRYDAITSSGGYRPTHRKFSLIGAIEFVF